MAKILIVEDNAQLAWGVRSNLEFDGHEVEVAEDGRTGLEAIRRGGQDLVILDLMLPEIDGYRVLRTIRDEGVEVPVLILSARGGETEKVMGFRPGADDYVTKPFGVLELLARVSAILRRVSREPAPEAERFGDVTIRVEHRTVHKGDAEVSLTPKEFDLLLALVRRRGEVASRVVLMREVWGHRAAIASRTVDTHIAQLRRKLEDEPSEPEHILTVHRAGYRFRA